MEKNSAVSKMSILKHPLLVALVAASFTALLSYITLKVDDIEQSALEEGKKQNYLRSINAECLKDKWKDMNYKKTMQSSLEIGTLVCPKTGHIYLSVLDWNTKFEKVSEWIDPTEKITSTQNQIKIWPFITNAIAKENSFETLKSYQTYPVLLCQGYTYNGMIWRKIQLGGQCYYEVINPYTGYIVLRNLANCMC